MAAGGPATGVWQGGVCCLQTPGPAHPGTGLPSPSPGNQAHEQQVFRGLVDGGLATGVRQGGVCCLQTPGPAPREPDTQPRSPGIRHTSSRSSGAWWMGDSQPG